MMRIAMTDERPTGQRPDIYRRQRTKNWLVAGLLLAFVLFVFVLSLVRMGGSG
jgi:hypothetical protein